MMLVQGGEFVMGSPANVGQDDEHPRHLVYLDDFYIDKYEVNVSRYEEFLNYTAHKYPSMWDQAKTSKHGGLPVIGVDWYDANAYCRWAGKRLPTEAEWEKAARGTDARTYPWGEEQPTKARANFGQDGYQKNIYDERLAYEDSYETGRSPYGVYHLAGNVWEWVDDWYAEDYYDSPKAGRNPTGPPRGNFKVLRGGSWFTADVELRTARRFKYEPSRYNPNLGFRCVLAGDAPS